jgi:hypothetical protein
MARSPHDIENQLRILRDFLSNMGMTVNTNNTKVMIIKSNNITYDTRNSSLRLLLHLLFFMDVKSGDVVSLVNLGER